MSSFKAGDLKREEYRKYLERTGVLEALTKVLVGLYEEPEKPIDALEFIRHHIGSSGPDAADVEAMKIEIIELREKSERLEEENEDLREKIRALESARKLSQ